MPRARLVAIAISASAIAATTTGVAQERIEVIRPLVLSGDSTIFQEFDVGFTRFGEVRNITRLPASQAGARRWVPLAGGRYLVGILVSPSGTALVGFDRRSRSIVATLPMPFAVDDLIADPVRPRVFLLGVHSVMGFDASTLSLWPIWSSSPGVLDRMVYAHKVDRLYLSSGPPFADPTTPEMITVVNAASGSLVKQFVTTGGSGPMVVDSSGRRLFMTVWGASPSTTEIAAYDAETGLEVARSPISPGLPVELDLDESRGRLLATSHPGEVTILDAVTLATVQEVTIPPLPFPGNPSPRLSLLPGRLMTAAHVIQSLVGSFSLCVAQAVTTFNIDGTSRGTLDLLPPGASPCGEVVLLDAPPSPPTPAAVVDESNVNLTWENPGNVSEFELRVGFAPGTTALTHRVGLETSVDFANVPPGTYYVRVRAINEIGTSSSPEIRVDVQ